MKVVIGFLLAALSAGYGELFAGLTAELPGGAQMEFVKIEPGAFPMGAVDAGADETPRHEVTISKGFFLGKFPVTQGQWEAVMESNPSRHRGLNHPVETVSWLDAQRFVQRLNIAAGDSLYRLPTEAEWEYACRAGTATPWSFGDDESKLEDYAWYSENNRPTGAKAVGAKLPNAWGLHDMHGNVWEWVQDRYGRYASGVKMDSQGPMTGSRRVLRGGYYNSPAQSVRSATRHAGTPFSRGSGNYGFRVLRISGLDDNKSSSIDLEKKTLNSMTMDDGR